MLNTLRNNTRCPKRESGIFYNKVKNASLGKNQFRYAFQWNRQYCLDFKLKKFAFNLRHENNLDDSSGQRKGWNICSWLAIGASLVAYLLINGKKASADENEKNPLVDLLSAENEIKVTQDRFEMIKDQLRKDNPLAHTLEFEFVLSDDEINELCEAIKDNAELGYIGWHKNQFGNLTLIENKLIANNKNYRYHPSDYVHGLLAKHAYVTSKEGEPVTLTSNVATYLKNWEVANVFDDTNNSGYYGAIYVNDKTHQVVLANRGTEGVIAGLLNKNSDWKTNFEEILGGQIIIGQQAKNLRATAEAIEIAKAKGYRLSFTGHSLGAWLAELSAYYSYAYFDYRNVKAVTFDSPGSMPMMTALQSNIQSHDAQVKLQNINIVTYLAQPNPANSCNEHVGRVYRVEAKMHLTEKVESALPKIVNDTIGDKIKAALSVEGHFLNGILETFDPESGKPRACKKMLDWPKVEYEGKDSLSGKGKTFVKNQTISSTLSTATQSALNIALNYIIGDRTIMTIVGFLGAYATGEINSSQYWTYFEYIDLEKEGQKEKQTFNFDKRFALITLAKYRTGEDTHLMKPVTGSIDEFIFKINDCRRSLDEKEDLPSVIKDQLKKLLNSFKIEQNGGDYILKPNEGHNIEEIREYAKRLVAVVPKSIIKVYENVSIHHQTILNMQNGSVTITDERVTQIPDNLIWKILYYTSTPRKEMELKNKLNQEQIVVVSGTGGMGKSTLVQNYGINKKKEGCQVRWIKGTQIEGEFSKLASDLKIQIAGLPFGKVRDLVYGSLERMTKNQVILIFDNVEDAKKIKKYLKNLPSNLKIIITSRNPKLLKNITPINVEGFNKQEAIDYLRKALGKNEEEVQKIIDVVGESPFRLSTAVSYLQKHSLTTQEHYIQNYKTIKEGYDQDEEIYPGVEMLFGNLKTQSVESWELLKYLAYLAPEGVGVHSIQELMKKKLAQLQELVNELENISLINVVTEGNEPVLKVSHRIIQEEIKKALKVEDATQVSKIIEKLVDKLNELLPTFDENSVNTDGAYALVHHGETLIKEGQVENIDCKANANLLSKLGDYYFYIIFDYTQAIFYRQKLQDNQKKFDGENLINLAKTSNDIGHTYLKLGGKKNLDEALKHLNESLRIRKTLFSNDHIDIAISLNNIGLCYQKLGGKSNLDIALTSYEESLRIRRNLFVGNNTKTATVLNNIGITYCELGGKDNLAKALNYFEEGLAMRRALFPGNHPDVALSLNTLGNFYYQLGSPEDLQKAFSYMEKALKMRQEIYDGKHPSIVTSLNNLGTYHLKLNDKESLEKGLNYFEESLKMTQELFSGNHFDEEVAIILNNLGKTHQELYEKVKDINNIYKALDYEERSLIMFQKLFESDHPNIGHLLHNIGKTYETFGDKNKAVEYMKQAYSISLKQSGDQHPKTKEIRTAIITLEPKFFDPETAETAQAVNCSGGNNVGSECRKIISLRGGVDDNLLALKKKIQESVLNKVVDSVDNHGWTHYSLFDFGVKGYIDQRYLKHRLGELNQQENALEVAQMLCFESMNLGIMRSKEKPYVVVKQFTRAHPELVKKIAVEHPEFFVDGSIVEACIQEMSNDKSFEEHLHRHVTYMDIQKKEGK